MGKAYGLIEITGVVAATEAVDIMCKTSAVKFVTWERKLGGRLVTIIVQGDVAAVEEAIAAARTQGIKEPVAFGVIANPHEEVVRLAKKSAGRIIKANNKAETEA